MGKLLRLPGLIDIHVHLRDPGQTHKEDFLTGTSAALAGGVTTVFDMPNNKEPIFSYGRLKEKIEIAKRKAVCDWGLYFGTDGQNIKEFEKVVDKVVGLKVYLNLTTGKILIENEKLVEKVFKYWPKNKIIVVHAEGEKIDLAIGLCKKYNNKIHITHISNRQDLDKILEAKLKKIPVTCDVTINHLFLDKHDADFYKDLLVMKPSLQNEDEVDYLWENLPRIDCIATDHAPHLASEKRSFDPPTGVTGVETMLPLLLTAVKQKRLTIKEIVRLTNTDPQIIFGYKQDKNTYVELDPEEEYKIGNKRLFTKCGWSPYHGWKVYGKVKKVILRGEKVFEEGKVLIKPGFGLNICYNKV